jgi:hypothetical protein
MARRYSVGTLASRPFNTPDNQRINTAEFFGLANMTPRQPYDRE